MSRAFAISIIGQSDHREGVTVHHRLTIERGPDPTVAKDRAKTEFKKKNKSAEIVSVLIEPVG